MTIETVFRSQKGENLILQNWILTNFHGNIRVQNVKYSDFLQLIIKIHIKTHMKRVGTTQKTQGNPLNKAAENTCFKGFWLINLPPSSPKCPEKKIHCNSETNFPKATQWAKNKKMNKNFLLVLGIIE